MKIFSSSLVLFLSASTVPAGVTAFTSPQLQRGLTTFTPTSGNSRSFGTLKHVNVKPIKNDDDINGESASSKKSDSEREMKNWSKLESKPAAETSTSASASASAVSISSESITKTTNRPKSIHLGSLVSQTKKILSTVFSDEFGSRGEAYFFGQVSLIYCILLGHVPLLRHLFNAIFGPLLMTFGLGICLMSIREMKTAFTAFSTPVSETKGGRLVMGGLYEYIRHPIYSGNLLLLVGLSVTTGSAMRLLLTGAYYLLVEVKTRKEEEGMKKMYGLEYEEYCNKVPSKFLPMISFGKKQDNPNADKTDGDVVTDPKFFAKLNGSTGETSKKDKNLRKKLFP